MLKWLMEHEQLDVISSEKGKKEVKLLNPDDFLQAVQVLEIETPYPTLKQATAFMDIFEFAAEAKCTPKQILMKIVAKKVPADLWYFPRDKTTLWLKKVGGEAFFNPAAPKPEEKK